LSLLVLAFAVTLNCAAFAMAPNVAFVSYVSIAATDTTISLHRWCRVLRVTLDSGSADVYLEINNNVATVGGATTIHVPAGTKWESPVGANLSINSFHYIGASALGKMTVEAY